MSANPALKRLGYNDTDRLVIIHCDDIGMCEATISAYRDLLHNGVISSVAAMVPCSWFLAAAAIARQHPQADMGVHLVLTSEWDVYRWGPVSTRDPMSGLMDDEGYFFRDVEPSRQRNDLNAAAVELSAQVKRALAAGVDVTHVDTHMGTLLYHRFLNIYAQTALDHHLPVFLLRWTEEIMKLGGVDAETARVGQELIRTLEARGYPLLDHLAMMPLDEGRHERIETAKRLLGDVPAGITHFILHPATDTPELRAICPDWEDRVGDYEVFMSDSIRHFIEQEGIQLIGYRALRDLVRAIPMSAAGD